MKIYVNAGLDLDASALLEAALRGHEVVYGRATRSILDVGRGDSLDGVDVVFGQPDPRVLIDAASPRFVQLTSAGWARYDEPQLIGALRTRGTILCNASSVFAVPVAEHAIAMMLSLSRRLPQALVDRSWPTVALRSEARVLRGDVVLLLGYGAIARAMVERLRPFGVELHGYRRTIRGDEEIPIVDTHGLDTIWLRADHIVDLLPEGDATKHFVDATRLARCQPSARFYNLGRGTTVDQAALAAALQRGTLDAAFLDVTTPEPLPADDSLWSTPRLFITPHMGGGHRGELSDIVRLFVENLAAFERGDALRDRAV